MILGLLILAGAPKPAIAERRIVVLKFTGKRPAKIQKAIVKMLKREHTVISAKRYARTAKRLRAKKPTERNVAKVLQKLEADGAIIGTVKKKRGRIYRVKIRIRTGTDGTFASEFEVLTRGLSLSKKARRVINKKLLAAIEDLPPLHEKEEEEEEEEEPIVGDDDDDDDDVEDKERVADVVGDDDDDEQTDTDVEKKRDDDLALTDEERADLLLRWSGMDVAAGLSFIGRTLSFTVRDGLGDLAPRGYDGAMVAGAYFSGELYPMAFLIKKKSIARNIGFTTVVDKVIKIESRLAYRDAEDNPAEMTLPSAQMRWGIGVVYRHNFGKKPTSPSVKLAARYSALAFTIDRTQADAAGVPVDIPDIKYKYIDPGLVIRFPFSTKIAAIADVRFMMISGVGDMQQVTQYGPATVTGVDGDVGLEYMVNKNLCVRAGGRYTRIGFDFDGTGELTNNRDDDPSSVDVFGAKDTYLGGYVLAGYRF